MTTGGSDSESALKCLGLCSVILQVFGGRFESEMGLREAHPRCKVDKVQVLWPLGSYHCLGVIVSA